MTSVDAGMGDTEDPWEVSNGWRSRAGRVLLNPNDPHGQPIATTLDRRWLWRVESFLAVSAATDEQRELGQDLGQFLRETCEHHWSPQYMPDSPSDPVGEHRQCLWCSQVEWGSRDD